MIRAVIFDFDGTIADTLPLLIEILNKLSDKFGYRKIDTETLPELRHKATPQILKELGISLPKLPFLVKAARKELNAKIEFLRPVASIKAALASLKKSQLKL